MLTADTITDEQIWILYNEGRSASRERKIEAAKRREAGVVAEREAGVVAEREGIAVAGRRIGASPRAEEHPPVLSTMAPRHYAETPDFYIGGPGSRISGGPEAVVPRGTTSIWQPRDVTQQSARLEQRSKPLKTSEERDEHNVRAARAPQEQAKARFNRAEGRSESAAALPVASTHVASRRERAGAFC